MDRLTDYKNGVCVYRGPGCKYPDTGEIPAELDAGSVRAVLQRLAEYEETGLEPKQAKIIYGILAEVAEDRNCHFDFVTQCVLQAGKAEKEGRLVVLPCKVTDTVYTIGYIFKDGEPTARIVPAQIDHVTISGTTGKPVFDLCIEGGGWFTAMEPGQFWRTRDEAEKALVEGGKDREAD